MGSMDLGMSSDPGQQFLPRVNIPWQMDCRAWGNTRRKLSKVRHVNPRHTHFADERKGKPPHTNLSPEANGSTT